MGQTIAEKILTRHKLEGTPVKAGDFIAARVADENVLVRKEAERLGVKSEQKSV